VDLEKKKRSKVTTVIEMRIVQTINQLAPSLLCSSPDSGLKL